MSLFRAAVERTVRGLVLMLFGATSAIALAGVIPGANGSRACCCQEATAGEEEGRVLEDPADQYRDDSAGQASPDDESPLPLPFDLESYEPPPRACPVLARPQRPAGSLRTRQGRAGITRPTPRRRWSWRLL
jgi:hypothetical protein